MSAGARTEALPGRAFPRYTLGAMRPAPLSPRLHLFVCANRRAAGDPLGAGCSAYGEAVYGALKDEVARRGILREVWITKTSCLGLCPKSGATLAIYPAGKLLLDVEASDAAGLLEGAL